jgi:hypothetical protein
MGFDVELWLTKLMDRLSKHPSNASTAMYRH